MGFIKYFFYQFILLSLLTVQAQAQEPITLMGINVMMTNDEIRNECLRNGFKINHYRGEVVTYDDIRNSTFGDKFVCKSAKTWDIDPILGGVVKGTVRNDGKWCKNSFTEYNFKGDGAEWEIPWRPVRRGDTLKCSNDGETIDIGRRPNSDWIQFSCNAFGACGSSLQEIADAIFQVVQCRGNDCILNQNSRLTKVGHPMTWMYQEEHSVDYEEPQSYKPHHYCMRGNAGDVVCLDLETKMVTLHKGNFGRKKLNFN